METYNIVVKFLIVLVFTLTTISYYFVEGKQKIPEKYRSLKHKGTVKTIVVPEDDKVIDCVEFYKQPAFDHPLIKRPKVNPTLFLNRSKRVTDEEKHNSVLYQNWRKYGECPDGTVPLRRVLPHEKKFRKKRGTDNRSPVRHEYAIVETAIRQDRRGAKGIFELWNPQPELRSEFSLSQMWVISQRGLDFKTVNTLEAGWMVYPDLYNTTNTVFFTFWTADGYGKTGCYNLNCKGFVQLDKYTLIGYPVSLVSIYDTTSQTLGVAIYRDEKLFGEQVWILAIEDEVIGYWPCSLFTYLNDTAQTVQWGGEIVNRRGIDGHHTTTPMGSGHFSNEGYKRAALVSNLELMDLSYKWNKVRIYDIRNTVDDSSCYDLTRPAPTADFGEHFFYGGRGYSDKCLY